jgi:hypothetical protein
MRSAAVQAAQALEALLAKRERLERLSGDHLQFASFARLGAREALRELTQRRELAGAEPVRARLFDPGAQLRVCRCAARASGR